MSTVEDRIETLEQKQKWIGILHSNLIIALFLMLMLPEFEGVAEIIILVIIAGVVLFACWPAARLIEIDIGSSGEGGKESDTNPPTAGGRTDE